jgi:phage-related protein/predicted XRE-type DNA-binding protein
MKPVHFVGSSRDDLRELPDEARESAGHQLFKVQQGKAPDDWKPMPTVGVGVNEIRVREERGGYRVLYVAKFEEAVYVLHVFAVSEDSKRRYLPRKRPIYRLAEVEEGATPMTHATVTKGSGNVFRDLGFSEDKSAELLLKSSLLQAIQETIKSRGWKQIEAAAQLGIDQAKVSKLLSGQMAGFSIERLVHFLSLLGQDVEVTVRKASRGRRGTVRTRVPKAAKTP